MQLTAVGASVVLADEPLVPDGVADHAGFLDEDLLLEPVYDLLPAARLDVLVEHNHAIGMRLAPDHDHLAAAFVVGIDAGPRLGRLAPAAADQAQLRPETFSRLALGLVVLGLRLLERAPHAQQVVAKEIIGR